MFVTQAVVENYALEVIALLIALYGAILATIVAVQTRRAERVSVRVSRKWGWSKGISSASGSLRPPETLYLTAVNNGRRDVVGDRLELEIPGLFMAVSPRFIERAVIRKNGQVELLPVEAAERADSGFREKNQRHDKPLSPGERMTESFDTKKLNRFLDSLEHYGGVRPRHVRGVFHDTTGNRYYSAWFEMSEHEDWFDVAEGDPRSQSTHIEDGGRGR